MGSFRVVFQAIAGMTLLVFAGSAQSFITTTTFDFQAMASGAYGESIWSSLNLTGTGNSFALAITGTKNSAPAFAYLDTPTSKGPAGLGVCGAALGAINQMNPGSPTNQCDPGNDDNITNGEVLNFNFDVDVTIDNFWFNNNHDGFFGTGDLIDIGTTASGITAFDVSAGTTIAGVEINNNGNGFFVSASDSLTVGFNNEQFYISGMTISVDFPDPPTNVPEPGTLVLLAFGLAGIGFNRRKRTAPANLIQS